MGLASQRGRDTSCSTAAASPPASEAADTTAPAETSSGAGTGADLATQGCSAINIADAQALVIASVTKIDFTPGSAELEPNHEFVCEFADQEMRITVDPLDSSRQVYQGDIADERVPGQPLTGVGDSAVWAGLVLSNVVTSAPDVIAHKGSVTSKVESPGTGLTITADTGPIGGSTVAETASFAAEMGALCNDIFTAIA